MDTSGIITISPFQEDLGVLGDLGALGVRSGALYNSAWRLSAISDLIEHATRYNRELTRLRMYSKMLTEQAKDVKLQKCDRAAALEAAAKE